MPQKKCEKLWTLPRRAVVVIISAIAELERNLIVERVKAGLRRAKIEGRRIGRPPLAIDRAANAGCPSGTWPGLTTSAALRSAAS